MDCGELLMVVKQHLQRMMVHTPSLSLAKTVPWRLSFRSIDPSLLYLIGDPTDPTVVWKRLSTQFQKKMWANKLALRRRLHSLRLKEGQSVQEHVKALTEIFNELSTIGDNVDDEDRVVYLLASLPDSYEMLVTALEANTDVPSMETVIERLLHEEQKLKDKNQGSLSTYDGKEEAMTHDIETQEEGSKMSLLQ